MRLDDLVTARAATAPETCAVRGPDGALTYGELDALANQIARALLGLGASRGDRIGIWGPKSVKIVAAMQAVLRIGAAYVPLDPSSPVARVKSILRDCQINILITEPRRAQEATEAIPSVRCLFTGPSDRGTGWAEVVLLPAGPLGLPVRSADDLAYVLYTSGSTGKPKGVCISHSNAMPYIRWVAEALQVTPDDRFNNHAPLCFDLSVTDLYSAFLKGASVSLISEEYSAAPRKLVEFIAKERISIWFSVPSVLILMAQYGGLLTRSDLPLRALLFGGEVFPIKVLRRLRRHFAKTRFIHLYGPTEANLCTGLEVTEIDDARVDPVPIGKAISEDRVWISPSEGAGPDGPGELMVEGPTVMLGYWGGPPQGNRPYATGDLVRRDGEGNFHYLGRLDAMIKIRGCRVDPGEIEGALLRHPQVGDVCVVALGTALKATLVAFVVAAESACPSLEALREHSSKLLPEYMVIDEVRELAALPRTTTGKVDRMALRSLAPEVG